MFKYQDLIFFMILFLNLPFLSHVHSIFSHLFNNINCSLFLFFPFWGCSSFCMAVSLEFIFFFGFFWSLSFILEPPSNIWWPSALFMFKSEVLRIPSMLGDFVSWLASLFIDRVSHHPNTLGSHFLGDNKHQPLKIFFLGSVSSERIL